MGLTFGQQPNLTIEMNAVRRYFQINSIYYPMPGVSYCYCKNETVEQPFKQMPIQNTSMHVLLDIFYFSKGKFEAFLQSSQKECLQCTDTKIWDRLIIFILNMQAIQDLR